MLVIADLDGDGKNEVVIAREEKLICFGLDGAIQWTFEFDGRVWSSPIVADLRGDAKLEIVFAARQQIYMLDAGGQQLSGFPVSWEDEIRSLGGWGTWTGTGSSTSWLRRGTAG